MNKRQLQKQKTRKRILDIARKQFSQNGFLNTTTAQISEKADIAHGTLFLHFKNKNTLILEILDKELNEINQRIQEVIANAGDLKQMLNEYLTMLQEDEDIFSVIARELPFYNTELRRLILFRESIIRSHFNLIIKEGISTGIYVNTNATSTVNFLFGMINYYLSLKSIFVEKGSVIAKFKTTIIETFMAFLMNRKVEPSQYDKEE